MKFLEDDEFVGKWNSRDPQTVELFVSHFMQVMIGMSMSCGLAHEEAQELTQQTFLTFFEKQTSFNNESKLSTYLFGIYFNKKKEYYRSKKKRQNEDSLDAVENVLDSHYRQDGHWSKEYTLPSLDDFAVLIERDEHFEDCLKALPEKHQTALMLKSMEGADNEEICHTLGLSYTNLRQVLARARQALRICLESYLKG